MLFNIRGVSRLLFHSKTEGKPTQRYVNQDYETWVFLFSTYDSKPTENQG